MILEYFRLEQTVVVVRWLHAMLCCIVLGAASHVCNLTGQVLLTSQMFHTRSPPIKALLPHCLVSFQQFTNSYEIAVLHLIRAHTHCLYYTTGGQMSTKR